MKAFRCGCGQRVFFDNSVCLACGTAFGFDPERMDMRPLTPDYRRCRNGLEYEACNWLLPADASALYCRSCSLSEVIPSLEVPGNLALWMRLENAKRRLLYDLLSHGLPLDAGRRVPGLRFRFLEDRRRNPAVLEEVVTTGHHSGVITINVAEADDVERTAVREQMQERYRTLLGHFRHESGHYLFEELVADDASRRRWTELFGDASVDYASSLEAYYRDGPPAGWEDGFVSAYATAHAQEDWAETFAHYLHIRDTLETARAERVGIVEEHWLPGDDLPGWILEWTRLSITLNELNRSLGMEDPYPFVFSAPVVEKLEFVHELVSRPAA
jgi:hypothetical protein